MIETVRSVAEAIGILLILAAIAVATALLTPWEWTLTIWALVLGTGLVAGAYRFHLPDEEPTE